MPARIALHCALRPGMLRTSSRNSGEDTVARHASAIAVASSVRPAVAQVLIRLTAGALGLDERIRLWNDA
jgi:hypothetical protein